MSLSRTKRSRRLHIESLEDRSLPSSTPILTEAYADLATKGLPGGWVQWASDDSTAFQIDQLGGLGGGGELAASARSGVTSRTWNSDAKLKDVGVSAAIYLNSLDPASVFVRARNLDTATPTYYSIAVTRGMSIELQRVVNGKTTTLSTNRSSEYLSGLWVEVSLRVAGSRLSVQVRSTDTGRYLDSSGDWVSQPVNALTATDTGIASEGLIGLGRGPYGQDRLRFDSLRVHQVQPETRELLQAERFDDADTGKLPDGWSMWANRPNGTVQVGDDQTLQLDGQGSTASRAWLDRVFPANVQVSSSVLADSLVPTTLIARGVNLNSSVPSYYGLTVRRGVNVDLVKSINGTQTSLGSVRSRDYVSGQWLQVSLVAKGNELRAQVFRTDTSQYLQADGTWGLETAWAIAKTDASLSNAGRAGLARGAGYAGTVRVDNFLVSTPPSRWNEGNPIPTAQDKPTNTPPPPTDSGTPPPLPTDGGNTTPPPVPEGSTGLPSISQHHDWIRIAQLAYHGTQFAEYENNLLRNHVDLVIPNLAYLEKIQQVAPGTPKLIYTNVSNIYLSLLTDWLSYADRSGVDREAAFYHLNKATAYTGGSPSSVPVHQFWAAFTGSDVSGWSDASKALRSTTSTITLAGSGTSLALGNSEKFREINVDLKTAAANGWTTQFEYVTAVDAQGRPTAWAPLKLLRDGTAGFRNDGTITFDPPRNWVAASISGSARHFYVRARTTSAGGTAPVFTTITGRDYTNSRGTNRGTIPAFDSSADKDGDGYLNDAEYAMRKPGQDARFVYESRLFYPNYGANRFATNVSNSAFKAWTLDYHQRFLKSQPLAAGLFVDNSVGRLVVDPGTVKESLTNYTADHGYLLGLMNRKAMAIGKWVLANTAGGGTSPNAVVQNGVSYLEEFALRPLAANYVQFEDLAATVQNRRRLSGGKAYEILDSLPTNGDPLDPRTQLATLSMYYLLADPKLSFLMMNGGAEPASSWNRHFTDAIKYNVGQPRGSSFVFASGEDPANRALDYKVFGRVYSNSLVLYKPLSYTKGTAGSLADNTATSFALGGTYRQVRADGTLSNVISRITLRNGEGAILAKA